MRQYHFRELLGKCGQTGLRLGLIVFLFFFLGIGHAQEQSSLDSLKQLAAQESSTSKKIQLLHEIAQGHSRHFQLDSIRHYAQKIAALAEEGDDLRGRHYANYNLGSYYFNMSEYENALLHFQRALEGAKQLNDKLAFAKTCNLIAGCHYGTSDYYKAIQYMNDHFNVAREMNFQDEMCTTFINMANIHYELGEYARSIAYLDELKQLGNCTDFQLRYWLYATNHIELEELDRANTYAEKMDSMVGPGAEGDYLTPADVRFIFGDIENKRGHLDRALGFYTEGLDFYRNGLTVYKDAESEYWIKSANIHKEKQERSLAVQKAERGHALAEELGDHRLIYESANLLQGLYAENSEPGKALHYADMALVYNDSLAHRNRANETYIEMVAAEKQLAEDKRRDETQLNQARNSRKLLTYILVGVVILLSFITYKNIMVIGARNRSKATLEQRMAKEKEMQNLERSMATDINTTFGGRISELTGSFGTLESALLAPEIIEDNTLSTYAARLGSSFKVLLNDVNDLLFENDDENNTIHSLLVRLREFVDGFNAMSDKQVHYTETCDKDYVLPKFAGKQLLFALKEMVNNFDKHAKADMLKLVFSVQKNHLHILVQDKGVGFEQATLKRVNGLQNITNRMASLNLSVDFVSAKQKGTTITINGTLQSHAAF